MEFRFRTRDEYEDMLERQIVMLNGLDGPEIDFEDYESLLDEYVVFCEESISGK